MLTDYPWPVLANARSAPRWTGDHFVVGNEPRPYLAYGDSASGWSAELTTFHSDLGGFESAFNENCRMRAIRQLRRYLNVPRPIVVDIGCAPGSTIRLLRTKAPSLQLIGADYVAGPL